MLEVDVFVTNRCPCKCNHCYMSSNEIVLREVSHWEYKNLFKQFYDYGIRELHITGGEPFIREDLESIVAHGIDAGHTVKINTCGIDVTKERLKKIYNIGVRWIGVPLEGNRKTHDMGKKMPGSYDASIRTIVDAIKIGFQIEATALVTTKNAESMPEAAIVLSDLGVSKITTFYYSLVNRGAKYAYLQPTYNLYMETVEKMKSTLQSIGSKCRMVFEYSEIEPETLDKYFCRIMKKEFCMVQSDGWVYPCPLFALSDMKLGNVWENNFDQIWNNPANWVKFDMMNNSLNKNCNAKNCYGGCSAYKWLMNGKLKGCDPRCNYEKTGNIPCCVVHAEHILNYN